MKITERIHQIRVDFPISGEIKRFVYIYIIVGQHGCYLIDAGVAGCEKMIAEYMGSIGRRFADIKRIFLTHSHPDHMGGAAAIKAQTGCMIYASEAETRWIENIDLEFEERPIPNFYGLIGSSVKVDEWIKDGDEIHLEDGIDLKVMDAKGHSRGQLAFGFPEEQAVFVGDAIPVKGDIPIYISKKDSLDTLKRIQRVEGARIFCPAWDKIYYKSEALGKIEAGKAIIFSIDTVVRDLLKHSPGMEDEELIALTCKKLNMEHFLVNPLFRQSILSHR